MLTTWAAALFALQAPGAATIRIEGFVQQRDVSADSAVAQLILPMPLVVGGRRVQALTLPGTAGQWARYLDRYVQIEGVLVGEALEPTRTRERTPPGAARKEISPSFSQIAVLTLALVPQRIAWRDRGGRLTGVQPVVYYTVGNHGQAPIQFWFTTGDVLCLAVTPEFDESPAWRDAWQPERPTEFVKVQMGAIVRYLTTLPLSAAPNPGRYTLRVSVCGVSEYEVALDFEVVGP